MDMKILVVDNHQGVLRFLTGLMSTAGYRVWAAEDTSSAMRVLEDNVPDLMFVDRQMAGNGGGRLFRAISRKPGLKHMRIVCLCGAGSEGAQDLPEGVKAEAWLSKAPLLDLTRSVFDIMNRQGIDEGLEGVFRETKGGVSEAPGKDPSPPGGDADIILENMSEGVLEIDPEGMILGANPKALALAGRSEEEMLRLNIRDLLDRDGRQEAGLLLKAAGRKGRESSGEYILEVNGNRVSLRALQSSRRMGDVILLMKDLTEHERLEVQLQQAQKMEAVATLAAGVAHDFNNLLMAIQGNTSLMLLDSDMSHPHYERLKVIEKQVQSGCKLTSQLLGYAMGGRYDIKSTDINRLVSEITDTFGRTRKEYTIRLDLGSELRSIEADQGQIEQVLLNLFINAADAMPSGGEISIRTENTTARKIRSRTWVPEPGDYVLLSFADSGMGIDRKTMKRIFDPFFTTKERGKGHGLGLSSAYGIIKRHGGHVDVESEVGRGTCFNVYLRASGPCRGDSEIGEDGSSPYNMKGGMETVLSVDDEEVVRHVGQEMLEALGYQVLSARDGEDAIRIFEGNRDRIDMVILDMVMPRMGGGEVFDRLKEIDPDIRVLLASGYSIDGRAREIIKRGCSGFIQKPYKMEELSRSVRAVLDSN